MDAAAVRCQFVADKLLTVRNECFAETLWTSLERNATKLALAEVSTGERATYNELMLRASLVASRLLMLGCRPGDVVVIFSPNSIAWVVVYLAVCRLGAIPAAINALLTADDIRRNVRTCQAKFIFTTPELLPVVCQATEQQPSRTSDLLENPPLQMALVSGSVEGGLVDIEAAPLAGEQLLPLPPFQSLNIHQEDMFTIFFSSGTTGPQKAVMMSNRALQYSLSTARREKYRTVFPVQLAFAPFGHITGGLLAILGVAAGVTTHIMARFNLDEFLRTLEDQKIEGVLAVPPIAVMMLKNPTAAKYRLRRLKFMLLGAMTVSAQLEDQLMERYPGLQVKQRYAMTESTSVFCGVPMDDEFEEFVRKPGSVGVPLPGVVMKVIDTETGKTLGPGKIGEIYVKSPGTMLGYMNNPQATADTIDTDGWLHTGDIGNYDEDGFYYVVDRLKDVVKYNGYQVPPAELEAVLLTHPDVSDAGVVGLYDAEHGELPLAWVVKKQNSTVTETQLQQFVDGKVAPFKKLRGGVHFVDAIPRTPSGKILRRLIKAEVAKSRL